jgi:hypothetical protein
MAVLDPDQGVHHGEGGVEAGTAEPSGTEAPDAASSGGVVTDSSFAARSDKDDKQPKVTFDRISVQIGG